ncbi:SDR family oxidoreductase [Enorma sp.]|uniref:SDR family NAD(P)-dependent oxidoreductase n=1 Tax=Enorma sp. TaxID=1920692 RepID=UPI0025B8E4A0|nr:SDR family oxidoreductase [Enorma sp.]
MDLHLTGKTAIVTGGGRGIGKGCVTALAEEGANVIVADLQHDDETLAYIKELAERTGSKIVPLNGDVSSEETVAKLYEEAVEALGPIDILVNNAGRGAIRKPFHELTTEDWRSVQEITLNSQFFMSREFVKRCRTEERPGSIVNVLSKSAFTTNSKDNTSYICAKAGAAGLTRGVANEMAPFGIRVNGVIPGYVQTERTYPDGEPRTERMRALLPTGKFTTPIEIGRVVAFLSSDAASQIIGACIDITGGTML